MLRSAEDVLALKPAADGGERVDIGVVGPYPHGAECAYEVRAFFSNDRGDLVEDPVTGSLNASLAQWLVSSGRFEAPYVARQGTVLGRSGRVHISQTDDGASGWVAIPTPSWWARSTSAEARGQPGRPCRSGDLEQDAVMTTSTVGCGS